MALADNAGVAQFIHACRLFRGIVVRDYIPVSILRKSILGRHRPVRVADGPMTARCRFT